MLKGILGFGVAGLIAATGSLMLVGAAFAIDGQAEPWQMGFQPAATDLAGQIYDFHTFVFYIITAIMLFVLGLLVTVVVRFSEKANPEPSQTSHNTVLEIAWTVIPIIILVVISVPSFRLLYNQYDFPKADLTIKATGNQWYWSYEYPDHDELSFDSLILRGDELTEARAEGRPAPRLLAVDNDVVVPVNKVVHVLVTASDVIHNWAVPAFGSKIDAVPGRITRTWFKANRVGVFYGQCSELCGVEHAFMPIAVRVVSEEDFQKWLEEAKEEFASSDDDPKVTKLAQKGDEQPRR